jgi:phytoene dehydrogenase-like protein
MAIAKALAGQVAGHVARAGGRSHSKPRDLLEVARADGLRVTLRHFDVVVIGRSLGCLTAAALLARRDFRVLVLGQGDLPASYSWEGRRIGRRAFSLLFGETPVWRRVLQDLAQTQTFRRRSSHVEPSFSLMTPHSRIQVSADRAVFATEIRREFPEIQPVVDELWSAMVMANRALEGALSRDTPWPPEGFIERLRAKSWLGRLPWIGETLNVLLDKLPGGHVYREAAFLPAAFAGDWAQPPSELPVLAAARLQHAFVRHGLSFDGGEDAFEDFLVQRIRAHGGTCELGERADGFLFRRGRVAGVVTGGGEQTLGADCVLTGLDGRALVELSEGQGLSPSYARWPELKPTLGRFVVSCWVRSAGLPEPLGAEAIVLPGRDVRGAERPALHVQCSPLDAGKSGPGISRVLAEALVPLGQVRRGTELRAVVLQSLREQFPFFDRHLLLTDSPHDGLPLHLHDQGKLREIERVHLGGGSPRPEPMQPLWRAEPAGFLGLAGEPIVGPVRGTYLVGKTVFPGLGQEGELLAAWNAAQRVTRTDRAWQKRRRQMWSKIDTESS